MNAFKRKLAYVAIVASIAVACFGAWGMYDKGVRKVDVLAIFAGGFTCGVSFLKLLQLLRSAPSAGSPPAAAPPKSKG